MKLYQITLVLFVSPPLILTFVPSPAEVSLFFCFSINITYILLFPLKPLPVIPLYFPGLCDYSVLYSHIWRSGVRNCIRDNMWCLWVWYNSLDILFSRCIHWPANFPISLFLVAELYSTMYRYYNFIIQSFVEGHFGCFHFLAIVNRTIMNWTRIRGVGCLVFWA